MLKEFKEFAMRGNVLDMAVGIIIGAAFGKIVTSFVERCDDAAAWAAALEPSDFSNRFISISTAHLRHDRSSQGSGGANVELRNISEQRHRLSYRGVRCVPAGAHGESLDEEARATRCTDDQRLPTMRHEHTDSSQALRALHGTARIRKISNCRHGAFALANGYFRKPAFSSTD